MAICPNCGEDNAERARFCQACATPLVPDALGGARVRKTVTVVFTDVAGSTSIGEQLDPESVRSVMARYFDVARTALERHGGTVEKFIGDAVVAVFGIPVLHEDDALRAVRAAAEMRDAIALLSREIESEWGVDFAIRTGVNTGEVVAGDAATGGTLATGDAMNVAARFEQAAGPGEVLVGEGTYRLVKDAVEIEPVEPLTLKGKSEPIATFRLLGVSPGTRHARRFDAPIVGRAEELARVRAAFEEAVGSSSCRSVTVVGGAGVGKSRLVEESLTSLSGRATVLRGRCLSYGDGITYWPIAEIVRQAAGIGEGDDAVSAAAKLGALVAHEDHGPLVASRVGSIVGLDEPSSSAAETFWAIRGFLEAVARTRPLVVVVDDIHWAEPTLLDLIDHVARRSIGAPILLLCMARPELLEMRSEWHADVTNATILRLGPLRVSDSEALIEHLLGQTALAVDIRTRVTAAAEGNPLFVEELLSMFIDEGLIRRDDGRWVQSGDLSSIAIPPTISALLAARLERVPADERRVLEPASVIGQVFPTEAISALVPQTTALELGERLSALTRKDLIRPETSSSAREKAFRFRHILIRDAEYESMPKQIRADLHEGFASWLEGSAGERIAEVEEIIGHHLEQAYRYRATLRSVDEEILRLAERAAVVLASAGRRAFGRSDMRAVVSLYSRAVELLPDSDPAALELMPDLGIASWEVGSVAEADRILGDAVKRAAAAGRLDVEARARVAALRIRAQTDPTFSLRTGLEQVEGILRTLESENDVRGLAQAQQLLGTFHYWAGHVALAEASLERSIELARAVGDSRQEALCLASLAVSLFDGPTDVPTGLGRIGEILAGSDGHGEVEARSLCVRGAFEAMQGRFADARRSIEQSRRVFGDLGLVSGMLGFLPAMSALVAVVAGDPGAAADELRRACIVLEEMGETSYLSTMAGELARVLCLQGLYEDALRFSEMSERTASPEDALSQVLWRGARSKVLARRGEHVPAARLARAAVRIADETDFLTMRADAMTDLAEVLRLGGRSDEAVTALRRAYDLYVQKGNIVSAGRTRAALEAVALEAR